MTTSDVEDVSLTLFVALKEELRTIEPQLKRRGVVRLDDVRYTVGELRGVRVALCRTGIGAAHAMQRARSLFAATRPDAALVVGFGGALKSGWETGECVVASEVVKWSTQYQFDSIDVAQLKRWASPEHLLERVQAPTEEFPLRPGRLVSIDNVLSGADEKRQLGAALDAEAVEMESAGVIEAAIPLGIPVLCARVILDEYDFELPFDFGKILNPQGEPRLVKSLIEIGAHPSRWGQVKALSSRASQAAKVLGRVVPQIVGRMK